MAITRIKMTPPQTGQRTDLLDGIGVVLDDMRDKKIDYYSGYGLIRSLKDFWSSDHRVTSLENILFLSSPNPQGT